MKKRVRIEVSMGLVKSTIVRYGSDLCALFGGSVTKLLIFHNFRDSKQLQF